MHVREIFESPSNLINNNMLKVAEVVSKIDKPTQIERNTSAAFTTWHKDILLDTIDRLENKMQMDNSHPLDKFEAMPIETYNEALLELAFIKSPTFREQAAAAQANLRPVDVLSLFLE